MKSEPVLTNISKYPIYLIKIFDNNLNLNEKYIILGSIEEIQIYCIEPCIENLFSIKRKELVSCINCGTNVLIEDYIFPLISINLDKLNKNSLNDILDSLTEPFSSSCIICSFDENKKLKNNIFFHSCKQTKLKIRFA